VVPSILVHWKARDFGEGHPREACSFTQDKLVKGHCLLCIKDDLVLLLLSHNVLAQPLQFMRLQIEPDFLFQLSQTPLYSVFAGRSSDYEERPRIGVTGRLLVSQMKQNGMRN